MRALVAAVAALLSGPVFAAPAAAAVPGTGCSVFPANNVWNTDISTLPVSANSAAWMAATDATAGRNLHPDFGPSDDPNAPYGIPFNVVDSSHQKVSVTFQYASESDRGPYPLGPDTQIEGGAAASGDRHALMVDRGSCTLYELYDAHYQAGGSTAGSGAVFNLNGNGLRPAGWTSADAAGLPIFPGLLRLDEVNSGAVNHAIRFTVQRSAAAYIWPARHQAGSGSAAVNPPMGARFRMKAGVSLAGFSPRAQVIMRAFQHYGVIAADNGSNWYFQGDANNAWPDSLLSELKGIPAADFEAVDESSVMLDPNSAQARQSGSGAGLPVIPPAPPPPPQVAPPAAAAATQPATVAGQASSDPAAPAADQGAAVSPGASAGLAAPQIAHRRAPATVAAAALAPATPAWRSPLAIALGCALLAGLLALFLGRGHLTPP
ncbi:MAG: hypothetical protein ACR2MY_10840 [Candidatus Dormibacteria bacterium]